MVKKTVTNEELAQMVQHGFAETATKFEAVAMKKDLQEVEKRLARQIDGLELNISAYASR